MGPHRQHRLSARAASPRRSSRPMSRPKHGIHGPDQDGGARSRRGKASPATLICPGLRADPAGRGADPRPDEGAQHGPRDGHPRGHARQAADQGSSSRSSRSARPSPFCAPDAAAQINGTPYLCRWRLDRGVTQLFRRREGVMPRSAKSLHRQVRKGQAAMSGNGKNGNGGPKKPVNVALQGGGSHGAFTWGVLDRLLEDGRLDIAAISGTSAGAMNAVALADGWVRGGADGARQKLARFLACRRRARAASARCSARPGIWLCGNWSVENTPGYIWFDAMSRVFSPYAANPFNLQPAARGRRARDPISTMCRSGTLHEAVHLGDQCRDRTASRLRNRRDRRRRGDGLGLPAA